MHTFEFKIYINEEIMPIHKYTKNIKNNAYLLNVLNNKQIS